MAFNAGHAPTIPASKLNRELRQRGWELLRRGRHAIYRHHDGTQISLPGRLTKDVLMGPAARIIMSKAEYPEARVSKVVTFLKVSVSPERVTNRYLEIVPNVMGWAGTNVMGAEGESR